MKREEIEAILKALDRREEELLLEQELEAPLAKALEERSESRQREKQHIYMARLQFNALLEVMIAKPSLENLELSPQLLAHLPQLKTVVEQVPEVLHPDTQSEQVTAEIVQEVVERVETEGTQVPVVNKTSVKQFDISTNVKPIFRLFAADSPPKNLDVAIRGSHPYPDQWIAQKLHLSDGQKPTKTQLTFLKKNTLKQLLEGLERLLWINDNQIPEGMVPTAQLRSLYDSIKAAKHFDVMVTTINRWNEELKD